MDNKTIEELRIAARGHFDRFDYAAARLLYENINRLDPADAQSSLMLGLIDSETGHAGSAINHLKTALQHEPGNLDALRALSRLLLNSGNFKACIHYCKLLLQLNPADADACSTAGSAHQILGNLVEAQEYLGQAAQLEPNNSAYVYKYGCVLQTLGNLDEALACFHKAADAVPGIPAAIGGIVRIHAQRGDHEKIKGMLDALLDACSKDPLVLPTLAHVAPALELTDTAVGLIEDRISHAGLTDHIRSRLHHALGVMYDKSGNYEDAFSNHQKSKDLMAGNYDADAYTQLIDRLIAVFSESFMAHAPRAANSSRLPVFIVGMPRSGTSLVEQILSSHNDVYGAGELPHIGRLVGNLSGQTATNVRYPESCRELTRARLDDIANIYLEALQELSPAASRVTDKMPHNFIHLGLIELLFPNARIIHVSRNPMDTCLSCYFLEFSTAHAYTRNLGGLAHHYCEYVRLMKHWNSTLGIPILNITYEDLVTRQEPVVRELIDFCELEWDDNCLAFHENSRIVSTLSTDQVRKPFYQDSIGRWKHYRDYLGVLEEALGKNPACLNR